MGYKSPVVWKIAEGLPGPSRTKLQRSCREMTWPDAEKFCRAQGARLCTSHELLEENRCLAGGCERHPMTGIHRDSKTPTTTTVAFGVDECERKYEDNLLFYVHNVTHSQEGYWYTTHGQGRYTPAHIEAESN